MKLNCKTFCAFLVLAVMLTCLLFVGCSEDEASLEEEWSPPPGPDISGSWEGKMGYYPSLSQDKPDLLVNLRLIIQQDNRYITGGSYKIYGGDSNRIKSHLLSCKIKEGSFDGKDLSLTYFYYEEDPLRDTEVEKTGYIFADYDATKTPPELEGSFGALLTWRFVLTHR